MSKDSTETTGITISHPEDFPTGTLEPHYDLNEPLATDEAGIFEGITEEDRAHQLRARTFVQEDVLPVIAEYWDLSLIHISEPTRPVCSSRMPSSA